MNDLKKRTWAEISLENIRHNYEAIRREIPKECRFLGVVKADAYGHGAVSVAHLLESAGADYLAVSCLDEALELRGSGVDMPILILGHTPVECIDSLIENHITQTVSCLAKAEEYSQACQKRQKSLRVHIKVDTGMSRLGFLCDGSLSEDGAKHIAQACQMPGLEPEGIFTHFAVADEEGPENETYTRKQFELFMRVIGQLKETYGINFPIRHCANSGAVLNYPEMALDMVRPGLLLYGYGDSDGKLRLKPGMRLVSRISTIKHYEAGTSISYGRHYTTTENTRIGVLSIGYADGLLRASSGKARFWTGQHEVRQCGNICMDMCMVDVTDCSEVEVGSEIEIFGPNARLERLAETAGTIPYELMCSVSKRVPRVYC